jgi:VanZ family protein
MGRPNFLARITFLLCVVAAASLSLGAETRFPLGGGDKINHIFGYACMTWLAFLGWPSKRKRVALIALGIGAALEIIQIPHPSREFSFADLGANLIGVIAATVTAWALTTLWNRTRRLSMKRRTDASK